VGCGLTTLPSLTCELNSPLASPQVYLTFTVKKVMVILHHFRGACNDAALWKRMSAKLPAEHRAELERLRAIHKGHIATLQTPDLKLHTRPNPTIAISAV